MSYRKSGLTGARRSVFNFAILALYLVNIASPALVNGSTTPDPSLTVKLDTSSQEALVTESDNITVHFTGSLRRDGFPMERSVIGLETTVDTGWTSIISPSTIIIGDGGDYSFEVSVVVPAAAVHEKTGTLVVIAETALGNLIVTGKANATVTPKAYFGVRLETDKSSFEIAIGEQVFMILRVYNTGNAEDSFEYEIVNLRELVNDHYTITLPTQVPRVPPGEYRTVRITAASPDDEYFKGDRSIVIMFKVMSVTARDKGDDVKKTLTFTVHVKDNSLAIISPYLLMITWSAVFAYMFWRLKRKPRRKP